MNIAWDIETCPLPESSFSDAQQARFEKNLRRRRNKSGLRESKEQTRQAVRALSPYLGWICCISLVRQIDGEDRMRESYSYTARTRLDEHDLLVNFWQDLGRLPDRGVTWITFNGKNFDVPFLKLRTLHHGLAPTRQDLLDDYPYNDEPHCDLWHELERASLDDACDLLGVPTPKDDMDGAGVWPAVQDGRMSDVVEYCEKDVIATLRCYLKSQAAFA
jgi:predicted PolB exonuclease-like 3'-5' exonuclease